MRQVICLRKMDKADRDEQEALLETYLRALKVWPRTAATRRRLGASRASCRRGRGSLRSFPVRLFLLVGFRPAEGDAVFRRLFLLGCALLALAEAVEIDRLSHRVRPGGNALKRRDAARSTDCPAGRRRSRRSGRSGNRRAASRRVSGRARTVLRSVRLRECPAMLTERLRSSAINRDRSSFWDRPSGRNPLR